MLSRGFTVLRAGRLPKEATFSNKNVGYLGNVGFFSIVLPFDSSCLFLRDPRNQAHSENCGVWEAKRACHKDPGFAQQYGLKDVSENSFAIIDIEY